MIKLDVDLEIPLNHFSIDVKFSWSGKVLGIVGPSGSGKSILLKTLLGHFPLKQIKRGKIIVNQNLWLDKDSNFNLNPRERKIGWCPQFFHLYPKMKVRSQLDFTRPNGFDLAQNLEFANPLLDHILDQFPHQLSGGQQQLVALVRSLICQYRLNFLDEPMSFLDFKLKKKVIDYLIKDKNTNQTSYIIISHSPYEIKNLCDEFLILENGKIQGLKYEL